MGIQQLRIKLEFAEQENRIIALEKEEYKKEMNELKQQNERLMNEKDLHFETKQNMTNDMIFFRTLSVKLDALNGKNDDLNAQIFEYQNIIKQQQSQNEDLQKKQSTKYCND